MFNLRVITGAIEDGYSTPSVSCEGSALSRVHNNLNAVMAAAPPISQPRACMSVRVD